MAAADAALLRHLRDGGALAAELARLRGLFLLAAPPTGDFAAGLFAMLDASSAAAPGPAAAAQGVAYPEPAAKRLLSFPGSPAGTGLLNCSPAVAAAQLRGLVGATLGAAQHGGHPLPPADSITGVQAAPVVLL